MYNGKGVCVWERKYGGILVAHCNSPFEPLVREKERFIEHNSGSLEEIN
jgi:hypothetical protein